MSATIPRASQWLRQARRDLEAARCNTISESHRRYFYQQAYEKGVKSMFVLQIAHQRALTQQQVAICAGCVAGLSLSDECSHGLLYGG